MTKISVIIPVYNVENTLRRCVDSFLVQSFEDFELLLIDDGSTDNTGAICDEYACKELRVRTIHTTNGGVSHARELGITEATGDYLIHADGDDWVEPTMLAEMYQEAMANDADIVICDFYYEEAGTVLLKRQEPITLEGKSIVCDILRGRVHGSMCNKLVRHRLYKDSNVHFPVGINYCEDALTMIKLFLHTNRVTYLSKAYYHYICNSESITRQVSRIKFEERQKYLFLLKQLLKESCFEEAIEQTALRMLVDAYYSKLFTARELKTLFPVRKKTIMNSPYSFNLKLLMALVSLGMYHLAVGLEKKCLHVKD
ncbi:glycosyltransferase [uncultured Bacteroides sp.]|uniref:glycosyltransferase family 2 protein n=1 Tax=uncultured Bacteroides sp. TaxID=162156 RepID=UPI0026246245|nr:glycosyltransferase [uncultured Bacteroides sp.]